MNYQPQWQLKNSSVSALSVNRGGKKTTCVSRSGGQKRQAVPQQGGHSEQCQLMQSFREHLSCCRKCCWVPTAAWIPSLHLLPWWGADIVFTKRPAVCSASVSPFHRELHCVLCSLECHLTTEPLHPFHCVCCWDECNYLPFQLALPFSLRRGHCTNLKKLAADGSFSEL